jgi:hypothetical protein
MNIRNLLVLVLSIGLLSCALRPAHSPVAKPSLPTTESECVSRGGEWIFAGPQNVTKYCFLKTTDGGKACKASSQCQSECVEKETGNVCADFFTGCFRPTGRGTVTQCVN